MTALYSWCAAAAAAGRLPAIFGQEFFVRGLLAGALLGPLLGLLGPLVLARRLAFFSATLGHAALAGVALGALAGEPPAGAWVGPLGAAWVAALGVTYLRRHGRLGADASVGVLLAFSLGLGVCLMTAASRRFDVHAIEGAMFGSVLTLTDADLARLAGVFALAAPALCFWYHDLLAAGADPDAARVRGVPVAALDYALTLTLATVLVVAARVGGALLVEGLVLVPAAAARLFGGGLGRMVPASVAVATLGFAGGMAISVYLPVPTGAAVTLALAGLFAAAWAAASLAAGAGR